MNQPVSIPDFPLDKVHAAHRQVALITAAIGSSLVGYAIIVEFLHRSQSDAMPMFGGGTLRIVVFAITFLAIIAATLVKAMLLRNVPTTPEGRLVRLRSASIISVAFAETPAVFGLVLFLTTQRRGDFYALLAVAAFMVVRHFPQRGTWENYVRRGTDAR